LTLQSLLNVAMCTVVGAHHIRHRVVASNSKMGYLCSIVGSCLYLIWGSDRNL
jgi:hypothetical protein